MYSFNTDEHPILLLPNMSVKQFLLVALASTLLTQSVSSEVSCNGRLDRECCKGKNRQQCSFKELGTKLEGMCQDDGVSLSVNNAIRHSLRAQTADIDFSPNVGTACGLFWGHMQAAYSGLALPYYQKSEAQSRNLRTS